MRGIVKKVTLIRGAIRERQFTLPLAPSFNEVTLVYFPCRLFEHAFAHRLSRLKVAFKRGSIQEGQHTFAVLQALHVLALVVCSVCVVLCTYSVRFPFPPCPHKSYTIRFDE